MEKVRRKYVPVNVNMIGSGGLQRRVSGVQEQISIDEVRKAVHELKNGKAVVYAEMIV